MKKLLMIERAILESCTTKGRTIFEIAHDTGLELSIVSALCVRLSRRGILERQESRYFVLSNAQELVDANLPENLKMEVSDLTSALVENYFADQENKVLKLQKVYVDKSEELILKSLLNQLSLFIRDLQQEKSRRNTELKRQKVIMWGYGNYEDLIRKSLELAN